MLLGHEPFLHPSVSWSLTLAESFDFLIGRPAYGHEPETRETLLRRVRSASNIANRGRLPSDPIDVYIDLEYSSLPRVPSWNRERISQLLIEERGDSRTCINALLEEEIQLSGRLGPALNKVEDHISNGYALNPSGRRSV